MSTPMDPAMRLLTPQSPYGVDVRRNSDVSALSLSSFTTYSSDYSAPATPMYTQSPLATQSFNTNAFDMSHVHGIPMEFEPKSTSFDERLTNSWGFLDDTSQMDHATFARPQNGLAKYDFQSGMQECEFAELQSAAIATTQPWYPTGQYTHLDSQLDMTPNLGMDINTSALGIHHAEPIHAIWDARTQSILELDASTIVPHDSMLNGHCVRFNSPDSLDDPYNDMNVPFEQHTMFKQEPASPDRVKLEAELSDDQGRLQRSICETRTGGKSVKMKREQRRSRVAKEKAKYKGKPKERRSKSKSKYGDPILEWDGDSVKSDWSRVCRDDENKWHTTTPHRQKFICKHPFQDGEVIPEGASFCGRPFARMEHHQRHKNTHKPGKDYPCLICGVEFNRNDNRSAHGWTHVCEPGKGKGRNEKYSLRQVISVLPDPKHIEMLLRKWRKQVGTDYIPEDEEDDSLEFVKKMRESNPDFSYDANMAVWKIRSHRLTHLVDPVSVS